MFVYNIDKTSVADNRNFCFICAIAASLLRKASNLYEDIKGVQVMRLSRKETQYNRLCHFIEYLLPVPIFLR